LSNASKQTSCTLGVPCANATTKKSKSKNYFYIFIFVKLMKFDIFYARMNARALFCGIWTCDVKVMVLFK